MQTIAPIAALVPLVLVLVGAARAAGLASRWTPLVAIVLGVVLALVAVVGGLLTGGLVAAAFGGGLAGASAVGLHQTGRKLLPDDQDRPPRRTVRRGQPVPDHDPDTTDR